MKIEWHKKIEDLCGVTVKSKCGRYEISVIKSRSTGKRYGKAGYTAIALLYVDGREIDYDFKCGTWGVRNSMVANAKIEAQERVDNENRH